MKVQDINGKPVSGVKKSNIYLVLENGELTKEDSKVISQLW